MATAPEETFMPWLHEAQLANTVTGFATCFAGILPLLYTVLTGPQPRRWIFAYWCILITGVFTVWFHAYEDSVTLAAFDTGSNIFMVWAVQIAAAGDFLRPRMAKRVIIASTIINLGVFAWMAWEVQSGNRSLVIPLGEFGGFYMSETALIANSFAATGLFMYHWSLIPAHARGLLLLTFFLFLIGLVLATADGSFISFRIFAWHAVWHLVSAFALLTLWLFNFVRFRVPAPSPTP